MNELNNQIKIKQKIIMQEKNYFNPKNQSLNI